MPISSTDLLFKYSVTTGSAGNSVSQGNPNASIGKYISTTQWTGGTLNGGLTQAPGVGFIGEQISSAATAVATTSTTPKNGAPSS